VRRLLDGWAERHADFVSWVRVHFFRFWTATAVIMLFGLCFWYAPELLTSWQKAVLNLIQSATELLPYPWSNRIQFLMINFGASIWLQFTLAIILLRVLSGRLLVGGDTGSGREESSGGCRIEKVSATIPLKARACVQLSKIVSASLAYKRSR
jgi:hypothetical protein